MSSREYAEKPVRGTPAPVGCGFPSCDRAAVTERGMCEHHRAVSVSRTGSWLERERRAS